MMTEKRNIGDLPDDLAAEILARFPATFVARLRLTFKGWNALIKDGRLVKKHSDDAPPRKPLVIVLIDSRLYLVNLNLHGFRNKHVKVTSQFTEIKHPHDSNSIEEVGISNVFHYDGLLLCTTEDNRLVVWNPCTGENKWVQLRKPYKVSDVYALGKSNSCNKYKILKLELSFELHLTYRTRYEIYDLTTNSWSYVGETTDWYIPENKSRGMHVNGDTFWLAFGQDGRLYTLLSFNFSTERFRHVYLPFDDLSYRSLTLSVTREEKQRLCMLGAHAGNDSKVDVWMATKIESNEWNKLLSVRPGPASFYRSYCDGINVLVDQENKVIMCHGKCDRFGNTFLATLGEGKEKRYDHFTHVGSVCSLLFNYVPTLAIIQ